MDKITQARSLLRLGWTWEEIASELDADLKTIRLAHHKDKRLACLSCRGIFEHIKPSFLYCGFTCWAGTITGPMSYTQLQALYKDTKPC